MAAVEDVVGVDRLRAELGGEGLAEALLGPGTTWLLARWMRSMETQIGAVRKARLNIGARALLLTLG
jgi:hypothetical protein